MSSPMVIADSSAEPARTADPTDTAVTHVVGFAASGPYDTPTEIFSAEQFENVFGGETGWGLGHQAVRSVEELADTPMVFSRASGPVAGRTETVDNHATATTADWLRALNAIDRSWGPGQVIMPGQTDPAAIAGLTAHAKATNRCALVDAPPTAATDKTALAAYAAGVAGAGNLDHAGLFGYVWRGPSATGALVDLPGSIHAAGVTAHLDRQTTDANEAPIAARGYGRTRLAKGVTHRFSFGFPGCDYDALYAAGVNLAVNDRSRGTRLYGFRSLAVGDPGWRQLNWHRERMSLTARLDDLNEDFLGLQLYAADALALVEATLRGPLEADAAKGALHGPTEEFPDREPYRIEVTAGSPDAAGLYAVTTTVWASFSPHAEQARFHVIKTSVQA